MEKVLITVTAEDIEEGNPTCSDNCPIARACWRVFPGRTALVYNIIKLYGGYNVHAYSMPTQALKFINDFDSGHKVQPFSFEAEKM